MKLPARIISSSGFAADPETVLRDLHKNHPPVVQIKMPFFGTCWVPTRHSVCSEVLKNKDRFVREARNAKSRGAIALRMLPRSVRSLYDNLVNKDDPDHKRLRSLVDQAFMRRNIDTMRGDIEARVDRYLDQLPKGQVVDISTALSQPLPVYVIAEMLGMEPAEAEAILDRMGFMRTDTTKWLIFKGLMQLGSIQRTMGDIVDRIREEDESGLIGHMWDAEAESQRLTREEIVTMVFTLFFAGHETTVHLINGLILSLLDHPEQREMLMRDPSLGDSMVDEGLRYFSPVTLTKPFHVAKKVQLRGATISRGQMVMPLIIAANRDPREFEEAHKFQIDRKENRHLSFSGGPHFCLGARLAKMETEIAITRLFQRFPDVHLAVPKKELKWRSRLGLRALNGLPLKLS